MPQLITVVSHGEAHGHFLYLLVTLSLAFGLPQEISANARYPVRSPLVNLADYNLLTTAPHHHSLQTQGCQQPPT